MARGPRRPLESPRPGRPVPGSGRPDRHGSLPGAVGPARHAGRQEPGRRGEEGGEMRGPGRKRGTRWCKHRPPPPPPAAPSGVAPAPRAALPAPPGVPARRRALGPGVGAKDLGLRPGGGSRWLGVAVVREGCGVPVGCGLPHPPRYPLPPAPRSGRPSGAPAPGRREVGSAFGGPRRGLWALRAAGGGGWRRPLPFPRSRRLS